MSFSVTNILSLFIEIITIILILHGLYGEKLRIHYKEVVLISVHIILMQSIDRGLIPHQMNAFIYVVFAIYCFWRFGNNIKKVIVNNAICIVFLVGLQMFCFFWVFGLMGQGIAEEYKTFGTNVIMLVLCIALRRKIPLHKISQFFQKNDVIIRLILVVGVGVLLICIYNERKAKGLYLGDYISFAVTFLVICMTTFFWQIYKTRAKEKEQEIQTYKLYESSYSNLISEIRLKQHEFNNHINAIYSQHLVCKNYEELVERQRQYCENILYDNRYEKMLKTGNSMLIGFLYVKFLEAEQRNIIVEYELTCTELNVKLPIHKIVELVGNLLNNAMDALEKEEDKRLYITITEETKYVLIEVRNICKVIPVEHIAEMFRKGYSSKGENRGLGLYNLKKMGREYGFEIVCSNVLLEDKNWISFSVELER